MELLVIAYPKLIHEDFKLIQNFRNDNDKQFNLLNPHFTFVFPISDISIEDLIAEINKLVTGFRSFTFHLRSATIHKDIFSNKFLAFLVPDEGLMKWYSCTINFITKILQNI